MHFSCVALQAKNLCVDLFSESGQSFHWKDHATLEVVAVDTK